MMLSLELDAIQLLRNAKNSNTIEYLFSVNLPNAEHKAIEFSVHANKSH